MKKIILTSLAVLAFAGCSKTLSGKKVEKQIVDDLGKTAQVDKVSCPSSIKAKTGTTFACTATLKGGQKVAIDGKITEVDGSTVHWETKVADKQP